MNKFLSSTAILAMLPMASSAATITWAPSVNLFAGGNNSDFISQNGDFVVGFNGGTTAVATTVGTSVFQSATDFKTKQVYNVCARRTYVAHSFT